jgi:hypothetical protein
MGALLTIQSGAKCFYSVIPSNNRFAFRTGTLAKSNTRANRSIVKEA